MLNDTTDFIGNAIGIDPSGCGCTDCLVGNSIPENSSDVEELLRAHVEEGREIVNRTYASVLLVYKRRSGGYAMDSLYMSDPYGEVEIIEEQEQYRDDYGFVIYDSFERNAEYVIQSYDEDADEVVAVNINDEDAIKKALEAHFTSGTELTNRTYGTLVVHESYGEYGHEVVDAAYGSTVSVVRS